MSESKVTPESLNLIEPEPRAIKYDKKMIKKVVCLIVLSLVVSFSILMNKSDDKVLVANDNEKSFSYTEPQIISVAKAIPKKITIEGSANSLNSNKEEVVFEKEEEVVVESYSEPQQVDNQVKPGLLSEYYEQKMLLKQKEDDMAYHAGTSFDFKEEKLDVDGDDGFKLRSGSLIPCTLITGINTDLTGVVVARVRENVYDSATGDHLLIPQGATLVGSYSSDTSYGQNRAGVVFNTINFPANQNSPTGKSMDISSLKASDLDGYSGLKDKVDNHFDRVAVGISVSSLLAAIAKDDPSTLATYRERALSKSSENISSIGKTIADKQIAQKPTIVIRGGAPFNILIAKDLTIPEFGGGI